MLRTLSISQRSSHNFYDGPRRYFRVYIHPDVEHFRGAATRYTLGEDFGEALACCHPAAARLRIAADGGETDVSDKHWAGVLRFVAGHVTTEIVAHEVTHAALAVYRLDVCPDVRLGNGCGRREETLAYIIGDLIDAASTALHDAGAWT